MEKDGYDTYKVNESHGNEKMDMDAPGIVSAPLLAEVAEAPPVVSLNMRLYESEMNEMSLLHEIQTLRDELHEARAENTRLRRRHQSDLYAQANQYVEAQEQIADLERDIFQFNLRDTDSDSN